MAHAFPPNYPVQSNWINFGAQFCVYNSWAETYHPSDKRLEWFLSKEGMKFTNSYAAAAICSPTRAALMTGKYPSRLGITDWIRAKFQGGIIPPNGNNPTGFDENEGRALKTPKNHLFLELKEKTIADYFKEAGYYSAHIGKWHLGQEDHYPELRGFDENFGGCDLGQPPSYFDPYSPPNDNPDYIIPNIEPRKEGEYLTDREGDETVNFIVKNKDKKFFLHWAPYAVHTPIQGREDLIEKYQQKPTTNQKNPVYAAMVESVDQNVGKLIHALDSLGLSDNTIVIFTSDNGGLLGRDNNPITNNFPLRSGKGYPYEGGIKIPTIIKWPRVIKGGMQNDTPIITMDILPTLMKIINPGFDIKKANMDGVDVYGLLKGEQSTLERDLFWHFPHFRSGDVVPYTIIRSGNYKLIKYYDNNNQNCMTCKMIYQKVKI